MLRIVIEDGEGAQHAVPLIRDEITIGRKDGNTIRLTERNVSRKHARLVKTGDDKSPTILVEDLDSYNGIKLNGERISGQCTMRPTDLLQIGDYFLELQTEKQRKRAASIPSAEPEVVEQLANDALDEASIGRLVVVSSNLAGQEYQLNRREVIIGRTAEENDLILNHRSISRHHAKFIFRDGAFTVLDLGSANGVKVNGEAFGTTTLVSGDILELGHVKLRYCAPGDEYVFTQKDIEDVDISGGPSVGQLVLIALVLVAVGAGAFFLVDRLAGDTISSGPEQELQPDAKPIIIAGDTRLDQGTKTEIPTGLDIDKLLAEGSGHINQRNWAEADGVFSRILQDTPNHPDALKGKQQAKVEKENQVLFDELNGHFHADRWDEVFRGFVALDRNSVYFVEASKLNAKAQLAKAQSKLAMGRQHVLDGDLDRAKAVQVELAALGYGQEQADKLAAAIVAAKPKAQALPPPPKKPLDARVEPPVRPKDAGVEKRKTTPIRRSRKKTYKQLCKEADKNVWDKQGAKAVKLYKQAIKLKPKNPKAYQKLCAFLRNLETRRALRYCIKWSERETNPIKRNLAKQTVADMREEIE